MAHSDYELRVGNIRCLVFSVRDDYIQFTPMGVNDTLAPKTTSATCPSSFPSPLVVSQSVVVMLHSVVCINPRFVSYSSSVRQHGRLITFKMRQFNTKMPRLKDMKKDRIVWDFGHCRKGKTEPISFRYSECIDN